MILRILDRAARAGRVRFVIACGVLVAATAPPACANDLPEPAVAAAGAPAGGANRSARRAPTLTPQVSGTTNRLQAVSPVSSRVVWASGLGGTVVLTVDGGKTWQARVVPGAENLQFRDVHGVSEDVAFLMAAGTGTDSRIYKTVDRGRTWTLQLQNQDPQGFYDCFAFFSPRRGITMADSVAGRFPVLATADGQTWRDIGGALPPAQAGEIAFAASGTCVATQGNRRAWIATGGAARARVLATTDGGSTWAAFDTPIVQGSASSGGFSIAFRDGRHGILGGGDLAAPDRPSANFARSREGGRSWTLAASPPFTGAIFGLAYAASRGHSGRADGDGEGDRDKEGVSDEADGLGAAHRVPIIVATGPRGTAWSADEGDTWTGLDGVSDYWAVAFATARVGWLVGTEGRILKIEF